MNSPRLKKVLGIALADRSLLVAELSCANNEANDRPEVRQLRTLEYPANVSLETPAELGAALLELLREQKINTSTAVFGLPARWIVAATKESPDASSVDSVTRNDILRLSAESEFSSELKDLVFDYVAGSSADDMAESTVLLVATPRSNVEAIQAVAKAARLKVAAIMPSAVALAEATSHPGRPALNGMPAKSTSRDALVLTIGSTNASGSGAELTVQRSGTIRALRHLRGGGESGFSLSELRRTLSTLPPMTGRSLNGNGSAMNGANGQPSNAPRREMIVWNAPALDAELISTQTGISIRQGDLATLGVRLLDGNTTASSEAFAPAVALGLSGLRAGGNAKGDEAHAVDFLHSRLAPVVEHRIPRWAIFAAVAVVAVIAGGVTLYHDLQHDRDALIADQAHFASIKPNLAIKTAFVNNVSFAQGWHGGDPRYLACVRDLTLAIPDDGQTIATSLVLREFKPPGNALPTAMGTPSPKLVGQLYGKTTDQQNVQTVLLRMRQNHAIGPSAKLGGTQDIGKGKEVSFSINFEYLKPDPITTSPASVNGGRKK